MAKDDKGPDVRERLLAAGLKIFANKGYGGSTVREICEEACSNIAAINYYFGDKAGFYQSVRDYARQARRENMQRCWELLEHDPWKALQAHIEILLDNTYNSTMSQINWMLMRELVDKRGQPPAVPLPESEREQLIQNYEKRMLSMLSLLLGPAATEANINLIRYTYHSLCLFLPIQTQIEQRFFNGKGRFSLSATHDQSFLTHYILDIVRRAVDDLKNKHASTNPLSHA